MNTDMLPVIRHNTPCNNINYKRSGPAKQSPSLSPHFLLFLRNMRISAKKATKAWFKRRILHAPNQIVELSACKMQRLKQLNSADLK